MSRNPLVDVAALVASEKDVSLPHVFQGLEEALAVATKKQSKEDLDARVSIDQETGEFETFRQWTVCADSDELDRPAAQLTLTQAQERDASAEIGQILEESIPSIEFGRIAAQTVKQEVIRWLRRAERERVAADYTRRIGELVTGTVKKTTRDFVLVELGRNAEAVLSREEMIPREAVRINDRLRCYLYAVDSEARGPQLCLSRTRPEMLSELFRLEVPEISEDIIEISAAARRPGVRAKIAVKTNDGRIDPIGACVGMRGSRVQAVSGELGGERIDIILWDDNPAQLIINAMSPAEVNAITIDEETHSMNVIVNEDQLAQAIGRSGENVRLVSELTGWHLNIMTEAQAVEREKAASKDVLALFATELNIDEDMAMLLVQEGFTSLEAIAFVPTDEMLAIEGFDDAIVEELQARAKDAILTAALALEERLDAAKPADDLLALPGMDDRLAHVLASQDIVTAEDLAEQAVDDVVELVPELDAERAAALIMAARAPWFSDENPGDASEAGDNPTGS